MGDLVCDGSEFRCNSCTSTLKLNVIDASPCSESKKLANQTNCFFPPPGGNCTFPAGAPPLPCPGIPPGSVISTGQSVVHVDGQTALGEDCEFLCPFKAQPVTLSKAGQMVAQHNGASAAGTAAAEGLAVALKVSKVMTTKAETSEIAQTPSPKGIDEKLAAENKLIAEKIANGHAYDKHILGQPYGRGSNKQVPREFPGEMRTRKQFKEHIERVINDPNAIKKEGPGNRTAYWDDKYGAVIIKHPSAKDGGTMFQPKNGKEYFDGIFKTAS